MHLHHRVRLYDVVSWSVRAAVVAGRPPRQAASIAKQNESVQAVQGLYVWLKCTTQAENVEYGARFVLASDYKLVRVVFWLYSLITLN